MKKQIAVIGLGRFGSTLAVSLFEQGHDVLAIDASADRVEELSEKLPHVVRADCTEKKVLNALSIAEYDTVIISIGTDIQSSIIIAMNCKELGVKRLIAKSQDDTHAKILLKIGVDEVVFPERDMANRLAYTINSSGLAGFMELAENVKIVEIEPWNSWTGKTLRGLDIRAKYGMNIIAIKRNQSVIAPPGPDTKILGNDMLVALVSEKSLEKLETAKQKQDKD